MASRTPSRSVSAARPPPRSTSPPVELSAAEQEKAAQISAACRDRNLGALVRLATSTSGLVSDRLRRTAWPLLLGCTSEEPPPPPWQDLPPHREEEQVALDVHRAFVYYPRNESEKQLDGRKAELSAVILDVLRRHPALCYFQGYHDIVQVFLLVLGARDAPPAVARLSLLRIRDFMLSSLDPAVSHLELLPPIIHSADPALYHHLPKSQPSFALANTITMFAHHIQDYRDITRLFDFFLARHTVLPIYFFAAVVLSRREELLEIEHEDVDILHATLGKLPQPFDIEFHIARSVELYESIPPDSLGSWAWWRISSSSVLKTSPTPFEIRRLSLADGENLLQQQEREVRRQQALKKLSMDAKHLKRKLWYYRRHGAFGLAIAVAVYGVWLGRSGEHTRHLGLRPLGDFIKRMMGTLV